ncbi:MAG: cell division protein FtsW [Phenylobacterium sp.]|jgi:cell division protein FtsW
MSTSGTPLDDDVLSLSDLPQMVDEDSVVDEEQLELPIEQATEPKAKKNKANKKADKAKPNKEDKEPHQLVLKISDFMAEHLGWGAAYKAPFDRTLVFTVLMLVGFGFVMISSASMPVAERLYGNPYHFVIRHGIFIGLGCIAALVVVQIPMEKWHKYNALLLALSIALLMIVLVIGKNVNGSTRWIVVGPITVQAAEPAKLLFFAYLASYLVRKHDEVLEHFKGFVKPLIVFFVAALLLLNQPDLGTVVVMFITTLSLLFLAGAKLWQFFGLVMTGVLALVTLIVIEPYRLARVTSFMDPWKDPYGKGYQLTQSLMAYGRGDWLGQGLGNSVQKLEYLPEAHTDFVMAVLAEELGLIGVLSILTLLLIVVFKAMFIGQKALQKGRAFEGYFALAIGVWFSFQTMVNVGASAGMLPTKGLTFPLVSYGGSSLLVMFVAISVLLRIDHELRMTSQHTTRRGAL